MNIEQWGVVAEIIGSLGTVALAIIVIIINRNYEKQKIDHDMQHWWHTHNSSVLSDPDLLEIEAKLHPYGDITAEDVKRMYLHFMKLNIALNCWSSSSLADNEIKEETIHNCVETTFKDKDFVIEHVLRRGYPRDFSEEIKHRYEKKEQLKKKAKEFLSW